MKEDSIWPTEVLGGKGAGWLNKLLRACKKSVITDVKVIGGTAKIQGGTLIISTVGGRSSQSFRGEYSAVVNYSPQDIVVISSGSNAGTYICTTSAIGHNPWAGAGYWIQIAGPNVPSWL